VRKNTDNPGDEAVNRTFPIVGIGASAGGLEALRQLFSGLPDDTGMAYVVIQHLDPGRPSLLSSVLAGVVRMPVVEVAAGMSAEPNRVHVIPPDADLSIQQGRLTLVPRGQSRKLHLPIDAFFRALADELPGRAIGVVLSGSAFDGTEGLRAIKAAGGITFAQEPDSAQFRSMPENAIAAGVVDFRAAPEAIASELVRLSRHAYFARPDILRAGPDDTRPEPDEERSLAGVLGAIRQHAELDFRGYKRPTLMRRISRRMALRSVDALNTYAVSLRADPSEAKALARDILIHVTSFFRDPAAFEALKQHVLSELLAHKDDDATVRVWVPGCSTGEEAYSLAICLAELLADKQRNLSVKIFGSDLSAHAVEVARAGLYAESDLESVSAERLARFFERTEGGYRIGKRVRDFCVFVRHDLTRDPPFGKLDLISCRNVLIYFEAELQRRVLPLLHHCLNTRGYLFLGSSEGIREFDQLFVPVDHEQRIFVKTGESPRLEYPRAIGREVESTLPPFQLVQRTQPARDAQKQADYILLARYSPPGVVINEQLDIVQFRGRTGGFLESPSGQPQTNVLKMARESLLLPLREAIETAKAETVTVRREGLWLTEDAQARAINLEVVPLAGVAPTSERHFLIIFEDAAPQESGPQPAASTRLDSTRLDPNTS